MARHELPREDLLRDARALVRRAELSDGLRTLFFGFHRTGAASFYFDQDPVYHLTSGGELRRAYAQEELIKAQQGKLLASRRHRTDQQVQLLTRTFTPTQQEAFLAQVHADLSRLLEGLDSGKLNLVGEVPNDSGTVGQMAEWLRSVLARPLQVAERPHVG